MWYRNHLIFTAKVTAKLVIVGERIIYALINHSILLYNDKHYQSIVVFFDSFYLILIMFIIIQQYTKLLKNWNTKFRLQYEYNLCEEWQNMIMCFKFYQDVVYHNMLLLVV